MKLTELFERYAAVNLLTGSPRTTKLYHHAIRSFAKTIGTIPTTEHLTDLNIARHMGWMISQGGAPESANSCRSRLLSLWRFAIQEKLVDLWPHVKPLPEPERIPLGWMPDELGRIFEAINSHGGTIRIQKRKPCQPAKDVDCVPFGVFWQAIMRICLDSGERIGAVRFMPRSAYNDASLIVPAGIRKGSRLEMLYHLQPDTCQAVNSLLSLHREKLIFPYGYSETYLYRQLNEILETAKLPTDRRSKFHRIRRTVASAVARAGGDPTKAMGHASPKTTKKYLDPRIVGSVDVSNILREYLSDPTLRKTQHETPKRNLA